MRKSKIAVIGVATGTFLLIGCDSKKSETSSERGSITEPAVRAKDPKASNPEEKKQPVSKSTPQPPKDAPPSPSGFVLKETSVEQREVKSPKHIAEVNSDFRRILKTSNSPALDTWKKYYRTAIAEPRGSEIVKRDEIWEELLKKISAQRIPHHFYQEEGGENIEFQKSLYGLYLAAHLSSSTGGNHLFKFIEDRAADGNVRRVDLDLFKIVFTGMNQSEGRLDKMKFDDWQRLSKLENPVYKMLAIQVGRHLSQEGGPASTPDLMNQRRLNYYKAFLNDKSQRLRLEALKSIRDLGDDLALPVLEVYRKATYGESDQIEVDEIFKQ